MSLHTNLLKARRAIERMNGCTIEYDCSPYRPTVSAIRELEQEYSNLDTAEIKSRVVSLRVSVTAAPDSFTLIKTFALVNEAVKRTLGLCPYDEQLLAAIAMHSGKIAQMQTGEGKTLAVVFTATLCALSGKGVHILTFNDYLAMRDARWMEPVYTFLGLSTAYINAHMSGNERRTAYNADITYLTAKEAGFDFLRDSICLDQLDRVQRPFAVALVDEADSILVDEARIPLVLAGQNETSCQGGDQLATIAQLVTSLDPKSDFTFDTYSRTIHLADSGLQTLESRLRCANLYDEPNAELLSQVYYALHACYLLNRDKEYLVRNGQVEQIDEFTGRVAINRRWPEGLQAAVEAKEGCAGQTGGTILNSISLQWFLRLYPSLGAMTATATQSHEDFYRFYGLRIVVIDPHVPCIRIDREDLLFRTKSEKTKALINEICSVHASARPILVGTASVAESESLADELGKQGVTCTVLNAARDEREAAIIAEAGRPGAVTISTNMAGRGVDIKLGGSHEHEKEQVCRMGGLYVIGTNRHESRRVDNQLRGRAGRQGDPGETRFFISLEDDLFVKYRLKDLLPRDSSLYDTAGAISNPLISAEINRVQRIIEGQNHEIRETLFRYSALAEKQRGVLQSHRFAIAQDPCALFREHAAPVYTALCSKVSAEELEQSCRTIALHALDSTWSRFLSEINELRDTIHLRRYGKQDPLYEFQSASIEIFDQLLEDLRQESLKAFNGLTAATINSGNSKIRKPSATWTYLINDNPFEDQLAMRFVDDIGFSVFAGLLWPLTALYFLVKRFTARRRSS